MFCRKKFPSRPAAAAVISAVLCSFLLSGCGPKKDSEVVRKPLNVQMMVTKASDEFLWLEALGEAEGLKQAEVRAQVSGILQKVSYKEGDRVNEGDVLFVIDPSTYKAAYDSAVAERKQVEAQLAQEEREAKRYKNLYLAKASSRKEWDDAQSAVDIRKALYASAKANEENTRIELERTRVKAPSSGIVGRAQVNPGALITETSTLLATITQPDSLRVTFTLSERDIAGADITLDNQVRLLLPDGTRINAKLDYVSQQMDSQSATRMMRALVPEGTKGLFAGQFVHVQLQTNLVKGAVRVPQKAVLQKADGTYHVFVEENGVARQKEVKLGRWKDTDWIVLSGLTEGERVIVDQIQRLRDKMPVTEAAAKAPAGNQTR